MTDQTLNCFLAKGTNADRLAFTPAPPTPASGPNPTYIWFETDTGDTYAYDGTDWQQVNNGGASADSAVWGAITGTLSDQADLQTALDAKTDEAYADAGDASTLADAEAYTDAAIASISGGGAGAPLNGIVSGCGVAYTGSLGFSMSAGSAYIDGALVTASAQTLTLDAADATNPRIDVLYLNDSGTFGKITGTAAVSPSQPATDPTTQLYLTFVLVPAAATDLNTGITTETIYDEGTEWTATASGTGFTVDSTNNPNSGTKCIEGTSVAAGAYVKFVDGSPTSFDGDGNLLLSIRSKASWNAKRSLTLQWYASGVAKGSSVTLKSGSFGFDSANTTTYQLLVIAKALFAVPAGTTNDELRITAAGSGGSAIGFYIDPIKLQTTGTTTGGGTTISGITQEQADARYAQRGLNLGDLASASTARTNLGLLRLVAFFFTTAPTASEVLAIYVAVDAFTIPANMSGSQVKVGTNPAATFAIDVQQNGSSIGTISISTGGVATLTTTGGTSKSVAAGDVLKFVAPASADVAIANVAINLKGTL